MKKRLLMLGTIVAACAPVLSVIACSPDKKHADGFKVSYDKETKLIKIDENEFSHKVLNFDSNAKKIKTLVNKFNEMDVAWSNDKLAIWNEISDLYEDSGETNNTGFSSIIKNGNSVRDMLDYFGTEFKRFPDAIGIDFIARGSYVKKDDKTDKLIFKNDVEYNSISTFGINGRVYDERIGFKEPWTPSGESLKTPKEQIDNQTSYLTIKESLDFFNKNKGKMLNVLKKKWGKAIGMLKNLDGKEADKNEGFTPTPANKELALKNMQEILNHPNDNILFALMMLTGASNMLMTNDEMSKAYETDKITLPSLKTLDELNTTPWIKRAEFEDKDLPKLEKDLGIKLHSDNSLLDPFSNRFDFMSRGSDYNVQFTSGKDESKLMFEWKSWDNQKPMEKIITIIPKS